MFKVGLGIAFAGWAACAWAADKPIYEPPAAWVSPATLPSPPADANPAAVRMLLLDSQSRFSKDGQEQYVENAIQVQSPVGLQALGNLAFSWNPETESLVIHKVHIVRGGQTIDALTHGATFTVLRRETNLERAMLDGALTAAFQPEGLQVGDILDFAVTIRRNDPVMQGHAQMVFPEPRRLPISHLRIRALWSKDRPLRWREDDHATEGHVAATPDGSELLVEANDLAAIQPPANAPPRYSRAAQIDLSDFTGWDDVAALMHPLYVKAATLAPESPLRAEIAKIRAASDDPKVRAAAALRLVQDKVRYLFLGMNEGGYVPAQADVTWARLFGDCKGKTALLLALLHELGIEAEPAFVSTENGDGLDARLPVVGLFNHVIVRAVIGGKVYLLDGTRLGDRTLDNIEVPPFTWALPGLASGAKLERLVLSPADRPLTETTIRLDASNGLDLPAPAHAEIALRGDLAIRTKLSLESMQSADRDRYLKDYWRKRYDFIEVEKTGYAFDDGTGEERLSLDGAAKMAWKAATGRQRQYETDGGVLGWKADFDREPGPDADVPFATPFPFFDRTVETILLPNDGAGFSVVGDDVDRTLAGFEFKRKSTIGRGVFTMTASTRGLTAEVPASQARADRTELRGMSDVAVHVQAPANYAPTRQEALKTSELATFRTLVADGYALEQKGDKDGALADYNRAVALDPKSSLALADRGGVLFAKGQIKEAQADFDKAIEMDPRQAVGFVGRARILASKGRWSEAAQAYDQALSISPDYVNAIVSRGQAYRQLGRQADAITDFDKAIKLDPKSYWALAGRGETHIDRGEMEAGAADLDRAIAINPHFGLAHAGRGRAYAMKGKFPEAAQSFTRAIELEPQQAIYLSLRGMAYSDMGDFNKSLADFNDSIRLQPDNPATYDSRAGVFLRRGDAAAALADFDKSIALTPGDADRRYRRALLLAAQNKRPEALKDLDAAIAAKPSEAAYLARAQLRPPEAQSEALADIDLAAKLAPSSANPQLVLAQFRKSAGDGPGELKALDEAVRLAPDDVTARTLRSDAYGRNNQYDLGLADLDHSVAKAPSDGQALNNRCYYKATWGRDFQGALKDCDAALKALPGTPNIVDSHGFVELRLERYDNAIADYDTVLKSSPTQASSLFGRAIAKLRKGDAKGGQADLAAAKAVYPGVEAEFARYGVKP